MKFLLSAVASVAGFLLVSWKLGRYLVMLRVIYLLILSVLGLQVIGSKACDFASRMLKNRVA